MDNYKLEKLRAIYEEKRLLHANGRLSHSFLDSWEILKKSKDEYFAALDLMSKKEGERE